MFNSISSTRPHELLPSPVPCSTSRPHNEADKLLCHLPSYSNKKAGSVVAQPAHPTCGWKNLVVRGDHAHLHNFLSRTIIHCQIIHQLVTGRGNPAKTLFYSTLNFYTYTKTFQFASYSINKFYSHFWATVCWHCHAFPLRLRGLFLS